VTTPFQTSLKGVFEQSAQRDALGAVRAKAWQQLEQCGLPTRKDEAFSYVSWRDLHESVFQSSAPVSLQKSEILQHVLPCCSHSHLVLVNGIFMPELSDLSALPASIVLLPLAEAMRSHSAFLQNHFAKALKEEKDPFVLLNLALHASGVFLYVPPKTGVVAPIQCLHVSQGSQPQAIASRLHLLVGAQVQLEWINSSVELDPAAAHFFTTNMDLLLEEGAQVGVFQSAQHSSAWIFNALRATLKRSACLKTVHHGVGAKFTRQSYRVRLSGEGSEVDLKGLSKLSGREQAHAHVVIDHEAPHTRSNQLFKGVLFDASQSSFDGKIIVRKEAQKTEAYQLNRHLILGSAAVANSKPNLEIFADDVKASHGATVTQPDAAQLFYLKSRGISQSGAQELLIEGFCQEIPMPYMRGGAS